MTPYDFKNRTPVDAPVWEYQTETAQPHNRPQHRQVDGRRYISQTGSHEPNHQRGRTHGSLYNRNILTPLDVEPQYPPGRSTNITNMQHAANLLKQQQAANPERTPCDFITSDALGCEATVKTLASAAHGDTSLGISTPGDTSGRVAAIGATSGAIVGLSANALCAIETYNKWNIMSENQKATQCAVLLTDTAKQVSTVTGHLAALNGYGATAATAGLTAGAAGAGLGVGYAISNLQGVRSSSERIAVIERIATTVNSNAEINMLNNLYDRICTKRYRQGGRAVGGLLITVAAIPGPHSPFIAAGAVLTGIIIAVSRLPGLIKKIKTNRHLGEESAERDYLAGSITQGLLGTINLQMYISSLSSLKFDGHLGKSVGHHRRRCPTIESVTKIKLSLPTHYWLEFHCLGLRGKLTDEYIEFICTALQGAGRHSTNDTKAIKVAIYNAFEEHWIELYQDTRNVVNAKLTT